MSARPHDLHAFIMRAYVKNTLRCFFDLQLPPGMRGCCLHCKGEPWWVGLPAEPYTNEEGRQSWAAIIDCRGTASMDEFQRLATEAALAADEMRRAAS